MMMEVCKDASESGKMQDVLKTTPRMEVFEKAPNIATRMEVFENAPSTGQMVGKSMEMEEVYSRPSPILGSIQ